MKRLYFLLFACLVCVAASAQSGPSKKKKQVYNKAKDNQGKFLEKQFWLGLKGGPNWSAVNVTKMYNIISPTNYEPSDIKKKYDRYTEMGSQVGMEISFYYKQFSFSFQPTYQTSAFRYTNAYEWVGDETAELVALNYEQKQTLNYLTFPILLKFEPAGNRFRPYLQGGLYQSVLLNATRTVTVSGVDNASGGVNPFENDPVIIGAKDLFARYQWGMVGGAGFYYNLGNVRLNLDFQYKLGLSNIASVKNRYGSDRLTGIGDALDDMTLDNMSVSVGCLFPLRFLESGFKSLDRK